LDENNNITAMDVDVVLNGGAYSGLSNVVLQRTIFAASGVYNIPALKVNGKVVATNTVPSGAFWGFGGPQAFFAIELHMNKIALKLGLDPLDFKTKHMVKKGDSTPTGGTFRHDVKLAEMIDTADKMSQYREKYKAASKGKCAMSSGAKLSGIGMSLFLHGSGFTGSGEQDHIKAVVELKKHADGKVEILAANVDMGQGLKTTLRKIISHTLEIPVENIIYENPDTDRVPDSGPTVASRTTMIVGKLLKDAAMELKERWNEENEFVVTKRYKQPDYIKWDEQNIKGDAYPTYSWGVNVVEVEIDSLTFEVDVVGTWAVFDVGRAIDERIMRGQMEGGVVQGLGYGTLEVMDAIRGRLLQKTITDYIIPTSMDFGKIECRLLDNPYEDGPFGAKGAGELTLVGAAPALAAAVVNATGIDINKLPVIPEYLMEMMENAKSN
jgi:CO/xanthine dehydrogenase Mo-binding subunit